MLNLKRILAAALALFCFSIPAMAGSHSWRFSEVFSDASGTVQFIELKECCGLTAENGISGLQVRTFVGATLHASFTFPSGVAGSTANKRILLATDAFAALPGAPARDFSLPDNFIPLGAGRIRYNPASNYDDWTYTAGMIPTDGVLSVQFTSFNSGSTAETFVTASNNPTNYAGCGTEVCDDNIDNDCDGLTDCDDPACALAVPGCVPTVSEWGIAIFTLLMLNAGSVLIRQRL